MTTQSLAGRTVLVTGANRGLGQALVTEALSRGAATVYAAARSPITHDDDCVVPLAVDLDEPDSIAAVANAVPTLDILINNAAIGSLGDDFTDVTLVLDHLRVNVLGPFLREPSAAATTDTFMMQAR